MTFARICVALLALTSPAAAANMMDLTSSAATGSRDANDPDLAAVSFHLVNHGPATVVPNFKVEADAKFEPITGTSPVSCFGDICMLDHALAPNESVDLSFTAELGPGETHMTITASALGVDELTPADNTTTLTIAAAPPSADDSGCSTSRASGLALAMLAIPLVLRRRRRPARCP